MEQILTWGPVLVAARGFALLFICGLTVILLAAFGHVMARRVPFRRWSGTADVFGQKLEFGAELDWEQNEVLRRLSERTATLEEQVRDLTAFNAELLRIMQALEAPDDEETGEGGAAALESDVQVRGPGSPPDEDG